jgi:hypothetical protein
MMQLPIWFQVIKEASALRSGIMTLPMLISMIVMSVVGGGLVTVLGYYSPFLSVGCVMISVGAGLMSTFSSGTGSDKWIGYQILFGAGLGFAVQQPIIAMQASLPKDDVPVGNAIMFFAQTLGGSCFLTGAQNIFDGQLVKGVAALNIPGLNATSISGTGATQIRNLVPDDQIPAFLAAYNDSIVQTFYLATGCAAVSTLVSFFVPWNSVKGKDLMPGAG